ncbi:RING finger protein 222-like [Arapaima gigas]
MTPAEKVNETEKEEAECPVCYEPFGEDARALCCGHVFCHGCLVRTLVSASSPRAAPRGVIVCPVCRHLTFITPGIAAYERHQDKHHVLEVPHVEDHAPPLEERPRAAERFARSCSLLSGPPPQIFIISGHGRPMREEDLLSVGTSVTETLTRQGKCTTAVCIILLFLSFTLLAAAVGFIRWAFVPPRSRCTP